MKIETKHWYIEIGRLTMLSGLPWGIYVADKTVPSGVEGRFARKWGREWRWVPGFMGFLNSHPPQHPLDWRISSND